MSGEKKETDNVKDTNRRRFLALGAAGAVAVASFAGYTLMRLPDGSYTTTRTVEGTKSVTTTATSKSVPATYGDPTFDGYGVQLPSLTVDPPHRQGSIYFRSDLSQLRLDDGTAYYTIPKKQAFSKGGVIPSPVAQKYVIWRAPFNCTITAVKGYQDTGSGSRVTAYDGNTNLLSSDITLGSAGVWQDGGSLAMTAVSTGDSIAICVVSVSGSPNYLVVQVEMTQP